MYDVLLFGVVHLSGVSKKSGEPYDFYLLNYVDPNSDDDRLIGSACVSDVSCDPDMLASSGIDLDVLNAGGYIHCYVSFDRRGNLINLKIKEDK